MKTIKIEDENGKVYEFEKPDFECEIFKATSMTIFGLIRKSYLARWDIKTGDCIQVALQTSCIQHYDISPIKPMKPKWHEDDSNFPALMAKDTNFQVVYLTEYDEYYSDWRLATKEEINSLYFKDK